PASDPAARPASDGARRMSLTTALDARSLPPVAIPPGALPAPGLTWGIFVISVTAILLGSFVGSAGAFLFLGLWVLLGLAYGRGCLPLLTGTPRVLWALPFLALASTLWSQSAHDTLKFSLEFVATVGCAVLAASLLKPRALLSALACCLVATALLSVVFGKQSIDPLTGSSAFVGVFESKNQLGFFTSLMLLAAVALIVDGRQRVPARLLGLLALALALPLLVLTRSGTAMVSAILASLVLIANLVVSRLSRFERARLLGAAVVIMLPIALLLVIAGDDVSSLLLGAMGKDATLTGRTLLWAHALQLIPQHPLLGYGYQAFWRQDTVQAESLWFEFHVLSRQGFHFHSTYVETAIELGYVGAAVLIATLLGIFGALIRWSWRSGSVAASFFTALMFCLLTRSFVEVDVLMQFQIGAFIMFVAATYAARAPLEDAE
ncbi:MAG: exopolysaccharide production protein ExoQ, partial [Acetobacteraceae bacterium]|nr:exopolysaccharide production protein ExoQ [Acetobacteraceae bacterium]